MYSLLPLITQSSPSRSARVRSPATSDPASDSVTAIEQTISPRIAGARKRCLSSWLPWRCSEGVAMAICTAMPMGTPPQSIRPSSSAATTVNEWSAPSPP